MTPDAILRWHRQLLARKWTYWPGRGRPRGLQAHLGALVIRMATDNPTWGYTCIQGALKNVGPPRRPFDDRPHSPRRAHSTGSAAADDVAHVRAGAVARARGADFFTTEVWTARGLVTYYTAFVLELQSRRVQVIGSTAYPDEAFVIQGLRQVTSDTDGLLRDGRILIGDRDPRWSRGAEPFLGAAGVRLVRTELIDGPAVWPTAGAIRCRERVSGMLSYYYRAVA